MEPSEAFAEYDKAMQDPEHRAHMERTTSLTAEEESEMYAALDELASASLEAEEAGLVVPFLTPDGHVHMVSPDWLAGRAAALAEAKDLLHDAYAAHALDQLRAGITQGTSVPDAVLVELLHELERRLSGAVPLAGDEGDTPDPEPAR